MKKGFSLPLVIGLLIGMLLVLIGFSFRHSKNKTGVSIPTAPTQEESVENSLSPSPMGTNNIQTKFMGKKIFSNIAFVNSRGENKRVFVVPDDNSGYNLIYVTDEALNDSGAIQVKFKQEIFKGSIRISTPSPGKVKYFYILASAGDYGRSAIIDEDGKIITEYIYETFNKKFNNEYPRLPFFEKWRDENSFYGTIYSTIDEKGNNYSVLLDINGNLISIDKI